MVFIDLVTQEIIGAEEVQKRLMPMVINRWDDVDEIVFSEVGVSRIQLIETPAPLLQPWETCGQGEIDKSVDGVWRTTWNITSTPIEQIKELTHLRLNRERNAMLVNELLVLKTPDNSEWQMNASSLQVLNEALLMSGVDETVFLPPFWRDANNNNHICTRELLISIAASYAAYKAEVFTASWMMKAVVDQIDTDTPAAIASVLWQDFLTTGTAAIALPCIGQTYSPIEV